MANYQLLTVVGYTGSNPEVRTTNNGSKVASFSIGVTEKGYTKQNGDKVQDHTEWFKMVAYGKTAETVEKYVTKGVQLMVIGRLRTEKYQDKDGVDKYLVKTICERVVLIDRLDKSNVVPRDEAPVVKAETKNNDLPF